MIEDRGAIAVDPPSTDQLTGITPDERSEWLKSGKLPAEVEAPPASPAPSPAEPAAASEPAQAPEIETRRAKTERRFKEILDDNRQLKERLAKLEAGKSAETIPAPAAEAPKPTEQSKPDAKPSTLAEKIAAINAKDSEFRTYEEKIVAIAEAVADDRQERVTANQKELDRQKTIEAQANEAAKKFTASKQLARTVHADFDDVTKELGKASVIAPGSIIEAWILESAVGTEIMYHFGKNMAELDTIKAMNPFEQSRALTRLEDKLSPPSATSQPTPAPKPEAPPNPRVLGSGATAPKDALEAALKDGDTARYIEEANRRDLEKARARRG